MIRYVLTRNALDPLMVPSQSLGLFHFIKYVEN